MARPASPPRPKPRADQLGHQVRREGAGDDDHLQATGRLDGDPAVCDGRDAGVDEQPEPLDGLRRRSGDGQAGHGVAVQGGEAGHGRQQAPERRREPGPEHLPQCGDEQGGEANHDHPGVPPLPVDEQGGQRPQPDQDGGQHDGGAEPEPAAADPH